MAQDLIIKLLLKTGAFSNDLKVRGAEIKKFTENCRTAGQGVQGFTSALGINVGSLAKFGTVVGAAALAGKELKAVLDSSQTTADGLQVAIAGAKGALESFNTALATGDFSAWSNGIWQVIDDAKELARTLDQLGNTQIAFDYMSKANQTKFNEAYNIFKDPQSTKEMKDAALKQMQEAVDAQWEYANNYNKTAYQAYVAQVVKEAGSANLIGSRVTQAQFIKAMTMDISADPAKARKENQDQYNKYLAELKEYETSGWDQLTGGPKYNNVVAVDNIKKKYADVIAIHAMLELMKDDELKGLAQILTGMESAKQSAQGMEKMMNRALTQSLKGGGTGKPSGKTTNETPPAEGSLKYWQDILTAETKSRDSLVKDTEEWTAHNNKVIEAQAEIDKINGVVKKVAETETEVAKGSISAIEKNLSELKKERDSVEYLSDDWKKLDAEIRKVESGLESLKLTEQGSFWDGFDFENATLSDWKEYLSYMERLRELMPVNSEAFKEMGERITAVSEKISEFRGANTISTGVDDASKKWTAFGQAMSNVSTIVSNLANTFSDSSEVTAASILQMVATTLPAVGQLIAAIGALTATEAVEAGVGAVGKAVSTSQHWIEAIAAVASLGAVVAAAIASAKNAGSFASGGIVGGSSFTGDRLSANVNSGEMILNRGQQSRLWNQINGGQNGSNQVEFHINGTELVGVLNNNSRKTRLTR